MTNRKDRRKLRRQYVNWYRATPAAAMFGFWAFVVAMIFEIGKVHIVALVFMMITFLSVMIAVYGALKIREDANWRGPR